jgi:cytochrome d ubiquinol oxidase subunit I
MVAIGFAMLGIGLWSLYLRWKGTLFTNRTFLTAAMIMTPSGFGAVLFGWFVAEIGRQPYVVYGHLRTADAVSPVSAQAVGTTLIIFIVVYAFVFGFGSYYLAKLLRRGPDPIEDIRGDDLGKKPKRPFSVPDEGLEGRPGHKALPAR